MRFAKIFWLVFLPSVVLSACNIGATPAPTQDIGAIQTQAMETVAAQFGNQQTQTAMAIPPTEVSSPTALPTAALGTFPTVEPFITPFGLTTPGVSTPFAFNTPASGFTPLASPNPTQAGQVCDSATFVEDVTVPDGTVLIAGHEFVKVWKIQNTGTCTWDDGYTLKYLGGSLDGYDIKFKKSSEFVKPGEIREFRQELTASLVPNTYEECWRMMDDQGYYFGTYLCVKIQVKKK